MHSFRASGILPCANVIDPSVQYLFCNYCRLSEPLIIHNSELQMILLPKTLSLEEWNQRSSYNNATNDMTRPS